VMDRLSMAIDHRSTVMDRLSMAIGLQSTVMGLPLMAIGPEMNLSIAPMFSQECPAAVMTSVTEWKTHRTVQWTAQKSTAIDHPSMAMVPVMR